MEIRVMGIGDEQRPVYHQLSSPFSCLAALPAKLFQVSVLNR
jgi:hypothetical protein